jgi:hypothetical protein
VKHSQTMGTGTGGAMLNRRAGAGIANVVVRATRGKEQTKDMTGKLFPHAVVVRQASSLNGQTRWMLRCNCTAEFYRGGSPLRKPDANPRCDACHKAARVAK